MRVLSCVSRLYPARRHLPTHTREHHIMGTLILPGTTGSKPTGPEEVPAGVYYLQNPATGVISKFEAPRHADLIRFRLFNEHGGRYTRATEAEWRAQAVELAQLQGRPLPAWADSVAETGPPAVTVMTVATPEPPASEAAIAAAHEQNEAIRRSYHKAGR